MNPQTPQNDALPMAQLKDILLRDDRSTLEDMRRVLDERALLSERVNPIIEEHMSFLRKNFPREYAQVVNRMMEQKLQSSQQDILNVIYPVMGKMINKYIQLQFQELKDAIDERIRYLTSREGMWLRLRNRLMGISDAQLILASVDEPVIQEIFLIQRDSGLLLGSAALQPTINRDVVAGMLSAIKSFVEDAFLRPKEDLEMIQYGTYKIIIENFPYHHFAVALSGSVSATEGGLLRSRIIDFLHDNEWLSRASPDGETQQRTAQLLEEQFIAPQRAKLKSHRTQSVQQS
jgi:hypothetical protein